MAFQTFLACSWKSRQPSTSVTPLLRLVNCDEETARGLKTLIGDFLGFHAGDNLSRLEQIRQAIVSVVVRNGDSVLQSALVPLLPPKVIVQGVEEAIKNHVPIALQGFPDEIWSSRVFVAWAACKGLFHKAISDDFKSDAEICWHYYQSSALVREQISPWISDSLKEDPNFVLDCVNIDPLIVNDCKVDAIRYDFDILLACARRAIATHTMDELAAASLKHGWADSLVFFAKALQVKLQTYYAFESFEFECRSHTFPPAFRVKQRIASFLDINYPGVITDLEAVWADRSIFSLAMGGTVEEICRYYEFHSKRQRLGYLQQCTCGHCNVNGDEDDDDDDKDNNDEDNNDEDNNEEEEEEDDDDGVHYYLAHGYDDDDNDTHADY